MESNRSERRLSSCGRPIACRSRGNIHSNARATRGLQRPSVRRRGKAEKLNRLRHFVAGVQLVQGDWGVRTVQFAISGIIALIRTTLAGGGGFLHKCRRRTQSAVVSRSTTEVRSRGFHSCGQLVQRKRIASCLVRIESVRQGSARTEARCCPGAGYRSACRHMPLSRIG